MIGIDIIEIDRIKKAIDDHGQHFLDRIFTKKEQDDCAGNAVRLAGRFAAKEAIAKALGTGFGKDLSWLDIEISNDGRGKPIATCVGSGFQKQTIDISVSHCKSHASAVALLKMPSKD